jgi:hypothetical protein
MVRDPAETRRWGAENQLTNTGARRCPKNSLIKEEQLRETTVGTLSIYPKKHQSKKE